MAKLELGPDEYVVMKTDAVRHGGIMTIRDVVLTNRKIVVMSRGLLGGAKTVDQLPLSEVKVIDDRPQAIAEGYELEIYCTRRQETFRFQRKKDAKAWAENIRDLLLGSAAPRRVDDKSIPGVEYVAESLKDTVDTVKRVFEQGKPRRKTAQDCESCGASISGASGSVVRCTHCGSDQQLRRKRG